MTTGTYSETPQEETPTAEAAAPVHLDTGVDKLIRIISREKKVEIGVAAKEIGVPVDVVQEWANFLQEDNLINVEYTLSKTYLLERQMTKAEMDEKSKEYGLKKSAFVRKVDVALQELDSEAATVEALKQEYRKVEDYLGENIVEIKDDVELLNHFEDLKGSIDKDIANQRQEYETSINTIHTKITTEENRYSQILDDIKREAESLQSEHSEVATIRKEEEELVKRVDELKSVMQVLSNRLMQEAEGTKVHEQRLQKMHELAEELREQIAQQRKQDIDPLVKISNDQEQRILRIQDDIVAKVKDRFEKVKYFEGKSEEPVKHLKAFFENRTNANKVFDEFNKTEQEMKQELADLVLKAKAFDLAISHSDMNDHIKELTEKFQEFNKKKGAIAEQMTKLKEFLQVK